MSAFNIAFAFFRAIFRERLDLAAENLALRQQLAIQRRSAKRPKLRQRDRIFWVWLSRLWKDWPSALLIVKPDTVVRWHRQGFKLYWTWKSRRGRRDGRPKIDREIRDLIRKMSRENLTWGAPRIRAELALVGLEVAESTVRKYVDWSGKPSSPTWRTFLKNHAADTAAIDFFTVPTATFRVLFCFIVLEHSRRRLIHFNVTSNPTAEWAGIQIVQAFPYDTAPKYLLRDNDTIYGKEFRTKVEALSMEDVKITPRSPWQNPFAERVIGSIRRDCLDHVIILGESHLRRVMKEYVGYYNESRAHQSLAGNSPVLREVEQPSRGDVIAIPFLGGLHHRYARAA
jgi:transposase InsO family protein